MMFLVFVLARVSPAAAVLKVAGVGVRGVEQS